MGRKSRSGDSRRVNPAVPPTPGAPRAAASTPNPEAGAAQPSQRKPSGFSTLLLHLHPRAVPAEALALPRTFGLGGIAVVLFVVLTASGSLLLFGYEPSAERAYGSVRTIIDQAPFGAFIRNVHHWAANGFLLVAFLHLLRVFYTGAHHPPRRANWVVGLALLLLLSLVLTFFSVSSLLARSMVAMKVGSLIPCHPGRASGEPPAPLAAGGLPAPAAAHERPRFEAAYGPWWPEGDSVAQVFHAGVEQRFWGPLGYGFALVHVADGGSLVERTLSGAELTLRLGRPGGGLYALAGAGLGVRHTEGNAGAFWTAGGGVAFRVLAGAALGVEVRYRAEDTGVAGFWQLAPDDRTGLQAQARITFGIPRGPSSVDAPPASGAGAPAAEPAAPGPTADASYDEAVAAGASEEAARLTASVVRPRWAPWGARTTGAAQARTGSTARASSSTPMASTASCCPASAATRCAWDRLSTARQPRSAPATSSGSRPRGRARCPMSACTWAVAGSSTAHRAA